MIRTIPQKLFNREVLRQYLTGRRRHLSLDVIFSTLLSSCLPITVAYASMPINAVLLVYRSRWLILVREG